MFVRNNVAWAGHRRGSVLEVNGSDSEVKALLANGFLERVNASEARTEGVEAKVVDGADVIDPSLPD